MLVGFTPGWLSAGLLGGVPISYCSASSGVVARGSKPVHALGGGSAKAWDRTDMWDKSTLLIRTKALVWAQPQRAA